MTSSNRESIAKNIIKKPLDLHKRLSEGTDHTRPSEAEHKQMSADYMSMPKARIAPKAELFKKMPPKVKKCMCGDCEECLKNFTHFLQIFSSDESVPEISAKSWCIWRKSKKKNI